MKLPFKAMLLVFTFMIPACSLTTHISAEFIFEKDFKIVKEFDGDNQITEPDTWFAQLSSVIHLANDKSFSMQLIYKNGESKSFYGDYYLAVGSEGHSGSGFLNFDDQRIDLVFKESYFLIFDLPEKYNPAGYSEIRTLHFQRW